MGKKSCWLCSILLIVGVFFESPSAMSKKRTPADPRLEHVAMLAREVYWPNLKRQPRFFVEYVGNTSEFQDKFTQFFQKQKVHGKSVQVTLTTNWENRNKILYPNLIFVSSSAMLYLPRISKFFENYPVLIISEQPYFDKGWMATLIPQTDDNGEVTDWSYSIEPTNIKTYSGLTVSAKLAPRNKKTPQTNTLASRNTPENNTEVLEKRIDYVTLLSERNAIIAQHEATIILLEDTIMQQREAIDSLSSKLALARYGMLDGIRKGLLWGATIEGDIKPVSALFSAPPRPQQNVNTAPWENAAMGLTIFFVLSLISISSVLILSSWSSIAQSSNFVRGAEIATMGAMAVAATEDKRSIEKSFLGNVSHELRTPLNAIVGLSQYVATTQNVDAEVRESLEIINSNAHGLMQMMNNILMLAMLQRNEVVLNVQTIDLAVLLAGLHDSMRSYLHSLKQSDDLVVPHTTQHTSGEVFISCDAEKLRMVFELLLSLSLINTNIRSITFGGVVKSGDECVLYVHASDAKTAKEMHISDFAFADSHLYNKDGAHAEISLDTAQGLLSLMGSQLYLTVGQFGQMYYFCLPKQESLS